MARPVILLLALALISSMAVANDATPQERGATVRGKLGQPSPLDAVSFEGDLTIGGLWAGTASFEARPHTFTRQQVWRVVEKYFIDYKGIEKRLTLRYMLSPDLSLRSGRADVDVEGAKSAMVFAPSEKGFQILHTRTDAAGTTATRSQVLEAPPRSTAGMPALLLLARALPDDLARDHALPWFPLADVALGTQVTGTKTRWITISPMPKERRLQVGWGMMTRDQEQASAIHLSSDRKRLVRFEGPQFKIVPKGQGGKRIALSEEKPANTWQQAFLKFGYGYHMARKKLLEEAFHWRSMYDHETKVTKSWKGSDDLEAFRDAWVAEFLRQSLRRSRKDTERLLNMTLASGKIEKQTGDEVVFAAHANFGGGTQRTYTLKKVDGVWYIAFVEF